MLSEVNGRVGNCSRFLHQGKEPSGPEKTDIDQDNRETHRSLLLPLSKVFKPTEILYMCDGEHFKI